MRTLFLKFIASGRLTLTLWLAAMILYCFGLSLFRCVATGTWTCLYLNWNLFLAGIPWMLTTYIVLNDHFAGRRFTLWLTLLVWLLFFPNAPYILTDLIHLTHSNGSSPVWFDLFLFLTFGWTGLALGLVSLHDLEDLLHRYFKIVQVRIIIALLLFVSSFGIYLGRFQRWNSWDVLQNPLMLLGDVADRFVHPFSHPRTWGVTILLGVVLNFIYWTIRLIAVHQTPDRLKRFT